MVLNVEQPGSGWFEIAFAYAAKSRGILDISFNGVIEFRRRGLEARFAPLPFLPSLAVADPPPIRSRPIDVLFVGYNSPRRERFFAAGADRFSRRSTAFVFGNLAGLRQASTPGYTAADDEPTSLQPQRSYSMSTQRIIPTSKCTARCLPSEAAAPSSANRARAWARS